MEQSRRYTVRLNTTEDADLVAALDGRNASRTFKEALRSQLRSRQELEEMVERKIGGCLYSMLVGMPRWPYPGGQTVSSEHHEPLVASAEGVFPAALAPSAAAIPSAGGPSERQEADPSKEQDRALEMLKKCAFAMLGKR